MVSRYSDWDACTKECGSGMKQKTRNIMTKPKNGGKVCPSIAESVPCNTGSCDKDCVLGEWSGWGPCSMACTPAAMGFPVGITKRKKFVETPIKANGKCP